MIPEPPFIAQWSERFEALSLRERALAMLVVIALIFYAWDSLLMTPINKQQEAIIAAMQTTNQQLESLTQQSHHLSEKLPSNDETKMRHRITQIKDELAQIDSQQTEMAHEFISPYRMITVLRDMLEAENSLTLKSLESLGTTTLQQTPLAPVTNKAEPNSASAHIYKHSFNIVFKGSYLNTLNYLKALENMPWRFYWDIVEYEVLTFPNAQISITIHTLSLNERWIRV